MWKNLLNWLDPILAIGTVVSIAVSAALVIGGNDTIAGLSIGLLSVVISLLIDIVARQRKAEFASQESTQNLVDLSKTNTEHIISSLQGTDIFLFERREDVYEYLARRIKTAKRSIDITHPSPSTPSTHESSRAWYASLEAVIRSGKVRVRRVMVVHNSEQLNWVRSMLSDFKSGSFFLGCYPKSASAIPMLAVLIIDGEEVILTGGERGKSFNVKTVSIKHPSFVLVAQEHFDACWRRSLKIGEDSTAGDLLMDLEKALIADN